MGAYQQRAIADKRITMSIYMIDTNRIPVRTNSSEEEIATIVNHLEHHKQPMFESM
jgi:hypothetical protein